MKKRIFVIISLLCMALLLGFTCFAENYDSRQDDLYDDTYVLPEQEAVPPEEELVLPEEEFFPEDYNVVEYPSAVKNKAIVTMGYIIIVFVGYLLPLALIVFSVVKYALSKSNRRAAWFIMTGEGVATALLTTLFLILT